jgi:hypothetical protein
MVYLEGAAAHGRNHPVLTSQYLDQRVLDRTRQVCNDSYDPGADMTQREAEMDAKNDYDFGQKIGEVSQELAKAIRTDLKKGRPGPNYMSPDVY